jgi:hypothetical protein
MSDKDNLETIEEAGTQAKVPTTSGAVTPDPDAPKKAVASVDKAGDATKPSKKRKGDKDAGDKTSPKQEEVESDEEGVDVEDMTKMEALRAMIESLKGLEKAEIKSLYAEMVKKEEDEDDEDDEDEEEVDESTKADLLRKIAEHFKTEDEEVVKNAYASINETKKVKEDDEDEDDSEDDSDEDEDEVDEKTKKEEVEIDMSDDIEALISGEDDLSEEFQNKAKVVFEAAVSAKIKEVQSTLEEQKRDEVVTATNEVKSELVEKVDAFLSYVAEEWVKDNELAIERGLKSELTENFITGLKDLFEDHYVEVPSDKLDVVDELAGRIESIEQKLNEEVAKNIELTQNNDDLTRDKVVREVSNDLTESEVEKLTKLIEDIENDSEFESNVKTIKESYFSGEKEKVQLDESIVADDGEESGTTDNTVVDPSMAAYTAAIKRVNPL